MRSGLVSVWRWPAALCLTLGLVGCGGSTPTANTSAPASVPDGLEIGLTDAPGQFAAYRVGVAAVTLIDSGGNVVRLLPAATRVDFARYADLTGLLTTATLPAGTYTGLTLTLDYSNADIRVETAAGDAVPVTAIRDDNGNPVTTMQVPVLMAGGGALTVTPNVTRRVTLDFDLQASNALTAGSPYTVTVLPLVLADVDPSQPKPRELRGVLSGVDLQSGTFQVDLRPFLTPLTGNGSFGTVTVPADARTVYEIDGTSSQGGTGLSRLAAAAGASSAVPLMVRAGLNGTAGGITATEVRAGASVPGYSQDAVTGTVSARAGAMLTLKAATVTPAGGGTVFSDAVTVQLASDTPVVRGLSTTPMAPADISVGQRLTAFGTLSGAGSAQPALDARQGRVRLGSSHLLGTVTSSSPGFAVSLHSIDGLSPAAFNFSGTGYSSAHDAKPADYLIDTGNLTVPGIDQDAPVGVSGFVTAFGQVGDSTADDFTAESLTDLSSAPALLVASWPPDAAGAFDNPGTAGLTLNLAGAGGFHYLDQGGLVTDLAPAPPAPPLVPVIQPPRSDLGVYSIYNADGTVQGYGDFADLVTALTAKLSGGARVKMVVARGSYDQTVSTLTAAYIRISLE